MFLPDECNEHEYRVSTWWRWLRRSTVITCANCQWWYEMGTKSGKRLFTKV